MNTRGDFNRKEAQQKIRNSGAYPVVDWQESKDGVTWKDSRYCSHVLIKERLNSFLKFRHGSGQFHCYCPRCKKYYRGFRISLKH